MEFYLPKSMEFYLPKSMENSLPLTPHTLIIQIHFFTHISMDIPTGILTHNYETAFLSFGIITDSNSQGYETIKMKKCHVKHFF